jgi:hypothetical protein
VRLIHRFQLSFVRDELMNIISPVGLKDFLLILHLRHKRIREEVESEREFDVAPR